MKILKLSPQGSKFKRSKSKISTIFIVNLKLTVNIKLFQKITEIADLNLNFFNERNENYPFPSSMKRALSFRQNIVLKKIFSPFQYLLLKQRKAPCKIFCSMSEQNKNCVMCYIFFYFQVETLSSITFLASQWLVLEKKKLFFLLRCLLVDEIVTSYVIFLLLKFSF